MTAVSYIAISQTDYDRLMDNLNRCDMVSKVTLCKQFNISASLVDDLVNQGKIKRYGLEGHRAIRFKLSEVEKLFKPI